MADRKSKKLRRLAAATRRQAALARAAVRAYNRLFKALDPLLAQHSYDAGVLDDRLPAWRDAVDEELAPEVTATYIAAMEADAREGVTLDAQAYATRYLATVHNRLVGVSDYVFDQIAATLAEGNAKGEPIPELAARVDALFSDTQRWTRRATVVARTEVVGANNAGHDAAARVTATHLDVPYTLVVKEWLATPDTRTRHTHAEADGQQVLGLDTRFKVGTSRMERPGDPAGAASEVIQCVVGSTQVSWAGQRVRAATRRGHVGKFIELRTARDHHLTATPNHPILTTRGYVPAEGLRVGDHVLATDRPPSPEIEDGPPSIEQVHRSLTQAGVTSRVPGSGVDFHGDVAETEVEVVRPDCDLGLQYDPVAIREGSESEFIGLLNRPASLTPQSSGAGGTFAVGRDRSDAATSTGGSVGSSGKSAPFLGGHGGEPDSVGLAAAADGQAEPIEAAHDGWPTDSEAARHAEHALASGMTPCEVVQVQVIWGSHDVFNLSTTEEWYTGNGIAQHNCRCSALYHFPGDLDYPDDPSSLTAGATMDDLTRLFDVSAMPPKLQAYWLTGPGAAKIGYGAPGQFARCQTALKGKVPGRMIDGTCANLIHKATGQWPGKHGATGGLMTWDAALAGLTAAADAENPMVEPPADAIPADAAPAYDPEDDDSTGIVIVALPAASDTTHGIGPEEKHCTIVYLGDQATNGIGDTDTLNELVAGMAAGLQPFTVAVDKLDTLGRDEPAEVWLLSTTDNPLVDLRDQAMADPTVTEMLQSVEQFPDYLPHVTIGYPESQDDAVADDEWAAIMDAAADVQTVTFDRLACWHGTDRTEYPLGDTPTDTAPPKGDTAQEDDAAMTSAATEVPAGATPDTATDLTWTGVLCPEGVATGDKRKFAEGAMQWFTSPVVLKAMFADKPGHDDSVPVGLITGIERTPEGKLAAHGTWDTGPNAVEARRQNIAGLLRGVSVDLDDVEMHLEDDGGNVLEGDAIWDMEVEPTLVVDSARIRAATLWCTPAYVEAYVLDSTVADQVPDTNIVDAPGATPLGIAASAAYTAAAAAVEAAPDAPPSSVFANPGLTEPTPLTITDDGRVFGHIATWGTCHIGIDGACVTPPTSEADYAYFCTGMYTCSDGEAVPVGTLTMGTGHADLALGWRPTVDHYDDTGTAAAYFSVGEDAIGIWFAGVLNPDLPLPQRQALARAGSVSGDWRDWGRGLELVAALAVNVPGFPIPRVASRVASMAAAGGRAAMRPVALVASGVVGHTQTAAARLPTVAELAREVVAYQARQARKDAVTRRFRKHRQQSLAGRIRKV